MRRGRLRWLAPVALVAAACRDRPAPPVTVDSAPPPSATPRALPRPLPRHPPVAPCRALGVKGTPVARVLATPSPEPRPLGEGAALAESEWIDVPDAAELTVQVVATTREVRIVGPALLRACVGGDEDVVLASGKASGVVGNGARPGAEAWIATPLGVVRYGDATIRVEAAPSGDRATAAVSAGSAVVALAESVKLAGAAAAPDASRVLGLPGGATVTLSRPAGVSPPEWARRAVEACEGAARAAEEASRAILADPVPPDAGTLGERTARHIEARRAARTSCGVAMAAAGLLPASAEPSALLGRVAQAEARWRRMHPPVPE